MKVEVGVGLSSDLVKVYTPGGPLYFIRLGHTLLRDGFNADSEDAVIYEAHARRAALMALRLHI